MLANIKKRTEGFTIIEVMIVLAIAGLIMVIVFLAVPQLQRSQRNTRAKDVISRVKTELENYASNNNGRYPWSAGATGQWAVGTIGATDGFITRYLANVDYNDPRTGASMAVVYSTTIPAANATPAAATIQVNSTAKCNGEVPTATGATGTRQYTMWYALEGGALYCVDNG